MTEGKEWIQLSLEVQSPSRWPVSVSSRTEATILGYSCIQQNFSDDGSIFKRHTIAGKSPATVETAIEEIASVSSLKSVQQLENKPLRSPAENPAIGQYAQNLIVECSNQRCLSTTLEEYGFILYGYSQADGKTETWPLITHTHRKNLSTKITDAMNRHDAKFTVQSIKTLPTTSTMPKPSVYHDILSPRQQKAIDIARKHGYYEWPRETTIDELAEDFGTSKPTFLDYLRSAESELLSTTSKNGLRHDPSLTETDVP